MVNIFIILFSVNKDTLNPLFSANTTTHITCLILLMTIPVLTKTSTQVISAHTPKRKKDKPKSIHLIGTDTPEVKAPASFA